MKKIKLKLEGKRTLLTKEDMKKISGGYGCCYCPGVPPVRYPNGTPCIGDCYVAGNGC